VLVLYELRYAKILIEHTPKTCMHVLHLGKYPFQNTVVSKADNKIVVVEECNDEFTGKAK